MDKHRLSRDDIDALYARHGLMPIGGGSGEGEGGGASGGDGGTGDGDNGGTGAGGDAGAGDGKGGVSGFKPPASQEEFDRMVAERVRRAEAKAKKDAETATRQAIEDEARRKKDEEEGNFKALHEAEVKKREDAERKLAERDLADRRRAIAKKHHVPDDLADRIVGTTDEELEADAKKIVASLKKSGVETEGGKGNGAGAGKGGKPPVTGFRFGNPNVTPWPDTQQKQE